MSNKNLNFDKILSENVLLTTRKRRVTAQSEVGKEILLDMTTEL